MKAWEAVQTYFLGSFPDTLGVNSTGAATQDGTEFIAEMINKTLEMGIEIYVCEASKQMLGWEKVELIPGVKIVGAATLNDLALDAGATMWF